jgi:ketosteroid isomerase-like protein
MSQENVEIVREAYEAFARGGSGAVLPFLDPELEWHDIPDQPEAAVHHGHEGFRRAMKDFTEPFAEFTVSVEELRDLGDYVLALVCVRGRGLSSGADFTQRMATLWKIRAKKATQARTFNDPGDALKAAGLSE